MRRLALPLLLVLAAGCQTNPRTGRSQFIIPPLDDPEYMANIGANAYAEMTDPKKVTLSTDPRLLEPLRRVGRAIAEAANQPGFKWEFKLIDDAKTANAWALPGGKIAFYTGIYPILKDENGLAIVMGHEVMHAILNHAGERMSQGLAAQGLTTAVGLALEGNEYRDITLAGLGIAASTAVILPYSRKHESEADRYGLYLAAKAGYDPEAAIGVWERMAELGAGGGTFEFLSTHPDPRNRIVAMRGWMPEAKLYYEQSEKKPNRPLPQVRK
jgi:predicted Zn-dependent protease